MSKIWPIVIAVADSLAIGAYILGVDPVITQVIALAAKIAIAPWAFRPNSILSQQYPLLLALAILTLISASFGTVTTLGSLAQTLGFNVHLFLTLFLVKKEIWTYFKYIFYAATLSSALFIIYAILGMIPIVWGRYFYFNGFHPNLGSEIAAAGVFCGVLSVKLRKFILLSIPHFFAAYLMQGRSALLAIVLVILLRLVREVYSNIKSSRLQFGTILLTPIFIAVVILAAPLIFDAMQLNSADRGLSSGLGGRDEQWNIAWNAFLDRPLTGQGLGWFMQTQDLGAHQFFLYGLAEMGLLSIPIFAGMIVLAVRALKVHGWALIPISPIFVMMLVNDRFMNLNLYPFILWIFLLALSADPRLELRKVKNITSSPNWNSTSVATAIKRR
jgi:O-antigen ligase